MPLNRGPIPDPTTNDIILTLFRTETGQQRATITYRGRTEPEAAPVVLTGVEIPAPTTTTINTLLGQALTAYMSARGFV